MSDPGKAVFLSYASQDAEQAKRIADALRGAGVEVWFDAEGGLEHGDEWDAKIRRQIKECVLFLPVISASTQAREEGYFRIEWELAAQRALGIASGVAFILPIVIDDTREPDALVPDRFRTVQWTRLRGGELTPEVKARFLKLWSHRTGALKHEAVSRAQTAEGGGPRTGDGGQSGSAKIPSPGWRIYAGLAVAVFALAAGAAWWMLRPGSSTAPAAIAGHAPAPIQSAARPIRDWPKDPGLKQAFAIITALDATIESCRLAEDMVNAVLKQRPTDPEATTVYAMLNNYYINRGYDASEERQVLARRFTERALQLAPDEPEALAAMAQYLAFRGTDYARADTLIRKAMALSPEDPRFARILVYNVLRPTDLPRALAQAKANAARFPQDPLTQYDLALISRGTGDLQLMEEAIDRTLALTPLPSALIWKGWLAAWVHGDLPGFKRWLDRISGNFRFNERAVYMHYLYACLSGDTAHGIDALEAFPGSWMNDFYYTGPRALLLADLLALAGKPELAQAEYDRALAEIGRMAERNSQDTAWRAEFWALRGAGREADARAAAKRMMQRLNRPYRPPIMQWWHDVIPAQLLAGDRADALALIREAVVSPAVRAQVQTALKIDQRMAPFRDDPEIQALLGDATKTAAVARVWPKNPELKQAIALTEGLEAIPDDLTLAEEITKRVLDRSPMDIEAVTVMARVQSHFLRRGFDRSDERAALAKRYAERALQLAPDEPEAMYALATYHFSRATGETARTEQLLRRAMELDPTNPRPGRLLADLFNVTNRRAEAIAQGQDNTRRFPNDVLSHYDLARNYKDQGRYDEFDRELDATIALAPLPNAIVWKARLQFGLRNDFTGMKTWLERVPARVRGTERAVFGYFLYAAFGGDPEAGLAALRDFPQKWFTDFEYAGPTALLNASLLELQGKKELALRQYEVAQGEIQRMRQADPGRIGLSQVEFWTLLGLGRTEEAKVSFRRMMEGNRRPYAQDMVNGWWFTTIPAALLIGDRATALTLLRESVETWSPSRAAFRLRFQIDPRMAPFREDPEIKALLAEPAPAVAATSTPLASSSPARDLVAKAHALLLGIEATREDFTLAEDYCQRALKLDPADGEVWAVYAQLHSAFGYRGWDTSAERREQNRVMAERAIRLAPDSAQAKIAQAGAWTAFGINRPETEKLLREVVAQQPDNQPALRFLAVTLLNQGKLDECLAFNERSAALPGGDPLALFNNARYLWQRGRRAEAYAFLQRSLAQKPISSSLTLKTNMEIAWRGDLAAAEATLKQIPQSALLEDRANYTAGLLYFYQGRADQAIAAWGAFPRDYYMDFAFDGPKGLLIGLACETDQRDTAAKIEWRTALQAVAKRITATPNKPEPYYYQAYLLACLGDQTAAGESLRTYEQLSGIKYAANTEMTFELALVYARLGRLDEIFAQTPSRFLGRLRIDPRFATLRADPRYAALLAERERENAKTTP